MNQHEHYSMMESSPAKTALMWQLIQNNDYSNFQSPLGVFFRISDQELATRMCRYDYAIYQIKKQPFYGD